MDDVLLRPQMLLVDSLRLLSLRGSLLMYKVELHISFIYLGLPIFIGVMQQQNRMPLTNKLKTIELELVDYFYSLVVMVSSTVAPSYASKGCVYMLSIINLFSLLTSFKCSS